MAAASLLDGGQDAAGDRRRVAAAAAAAAVAAAVRQQVHIAPSIRAPSNLPWTDNEQQHGGQGPHQSGAAPGRHCAARSFAKRVWAIRLYCN